MTMCAESVAVFKIILYNAEGGGSTDNLMKENINHKSRVDHMANYSFFQGVNPSVTNRNRKDEDIGQQNKATIPVVILKYYDPPVATATLLFYI